MLLDCAPPAPPGPPGPPGGGGGMPPPAAPDAWSDARPASNSACESWPSPSVSSLANSSSLLVPVLLAVPPDIFSSRPCSSSWLTLPSPSLSTLPNRSSPAMPRDWANSTVVGGGGSRFFIALPSSSPFRLPSPSASYCASMSLALVSRLMPVFCATSSIKDCSSVPSTPPLWSVSSLESSFSGVRWPALRCRLALDQALATLLMLVMVGSFRSGPGRAAPAWNPFLKERVNRCCPVCTGADTKAHPRCRTGGQRPRISPLAVAGALPTLARPGHIPRACPTSWSSTTTKTSPRC